MHLEYFSHATFEMAGAFGYEGRLDDLCRDGGKAGFLEFVDVPAGDHADVVSLFEQVGAGDVDNQLFASLYQLVGIANVAYGQEYEAWVGGVDGRLPAKGHYVGRFHIAGSHQQDAAGLDEPFRSFQFDFVFHWASLRIVATFSRGRHRLRLFSGDWIPACAGMTHWRRNDTLAQE